MFRFKIKDAHTVSVFLQELVMEKQYRLKESMKMMGLANWIHWLAWFLKNFFFLLISSVLLSILLKVTALLSSNWPFIWWSDEMWLNLKVDLIARTTEPEFTHAYTSINPCLISCSWTHLTLPICLKIRIYLSGCSNFWFFRWHYYLRVPYGLLHISDFLLLLDKVSGLF